MIRKDISLSQALSELGFPDDLKLSRPAGPVEKYDDKTLFVLTPDELEDFIDAAAVDARRGEEAFPFVLTKEILAGGNPVRVFRKHRGLSMQKLADFCEINQGYLSEIERGLKLPRLNILYRIATALRVDIANLIVDRPAS